MARLWLVLLCGSLLLEVGGVGQSELRLSAGVQTGKQVIEDVKILLLGTLRDYPRFLQ